MGQNRELTLRRTHNVRLYACTQVPWCVRRYKVPSIDEHLHFDAKFVILYFAEGLGVVLRFPEGEDDKICTKLVGSLILYCVCIMTFSALVQHLGTLMNLSGK